MHTKSELLLIVAGLTVMTTLALAQSDTPGGVPAASRDISAIKPGAAKSAPKHNTKHKKAKPAADTPTPAK